MMILVTAFDPFHNEATNASQLVLDELKTRVEIQTQILPTSFHRCYPILRQAVASYKPDAVIMLGEAEDRPHISLERIAINLNDARIQDNDGVQLVKTKIEQKGPDGLFTRLPIDPVIEEVTEQGHQVSVSNTAGTFVCNHIMYEALYHLPKSMPVGFIHVPILKEQGYDTPFQFEKEDIVATMVKVILAMKKHIPVVE
jgi:pyroglutamyl-peptidase